MTKHTDGTAVPSIRKGMYRHNKSGNMYEVIGTALDTENNIPIVVYKPLYEHEYGYELFARPYVMFVENVELEGRTMPRFEYVDD